MRLLGDYLRSLTTVLLTQFSRKRFPGGMAGVVHLAERNSPIQVARQLGPYFLLDAWFGQLAPKKPL